MGCASSSSSPVSKSSPEKKFDSVEANHNNNALVSAAEDKNNQPIGSDAVNFKAIHSAFRWNKPVAEIEVMLTTLEAVNSADATNGNRPIHIAAQNGHTDLVKLLIRKKADLNLQNAKGNTALHMAIGYDYFETAQIMIAAGADLEITNETGIPAKFGLEGNKALGVAALGSAKTSNEVLEAFQLCEGVIDKLDRVNFVQAGLKAKKTLGPAWTADLQNAFKDMTNRLP
jgi:ankyrin repeat protein